MDAIQNTFNGLCEMYEFLNKPRKISITTLCRTVGLATEYSSFLINDMIIVKSYGEKPRDYKWSWIGDAPTKDIASIYVARFNELRREQDKSYRENKVATNQEIMIKLDAIIRHFKIKV